MIYVSGTKNWGNEGKYLNDCVDTGWYSSLGKYVKLLESAFAQKIGTKHAIACSNGTAGLFTAVRILGIGKGDEIIIPDFTIIVTSNVAILNGAKPVLVDVEPDTWCMDPAKIEAAITPRTRAIMAVHMYGHPVDMEKINAIAKKHHLYVIEDCCESHGSKVNDIYTGALSDISVFSFYANKTLTSGEGGMILTNNDDLAMKMRMFIDNGFTIPRFIHHMIGFNFRLSNLQAAVGLAQTEHFDDAVNRKREIAHLYLKEFGKFPHITLPVEKPWATNTYWMFGILLNDSFGMTKEDVMQALTAKGIETRSFFYPMHEQPVFTDNDDSNYPNVEGTWPISHDIAHRGLYLPSGLDLTKQEIKYVAQSVMELATTKK